MFLKAQNKMKDNRVNKQKRVGILGHFGFGHNLYNGQVIKN